MSLCSYMPVKNNDIHSTQLVITVSENHVLQKLNTISHFHISAIKPWPVGSTNKSMQVNESESLLCTKGLLTFSAAIFTEYLARPNQMKKQLLISQHYQLDTILILVWKLYYRCLCVWDALMGCFVEVIELCFLISIGSERKWITSTVCEAF